MCANYLRTRKVEKNSSEKSLEKMSRMKMKYRKKKKTKIEVKNECVIIA